MSAGDKQHYFEQAAEQRNELHLASHEQHRLTTASIIENGIKTERNKFVYEVSNPVNRITRLRAHHFLFSL